MTDRASRPREGRNTAFGEWLREQMAAREMTQAELAELVGVTPAAVSWWATGRTAPTRASLERVAHALGYRNADALRAAGVPEPLVRGA